MLLVCAAKNSLQSGARMVFVFQTSQTDSVAIFPEEICVSKNAENSVL